MKKLIFVTCAVFISLAQASACEQYEAQMSAKVDAVEMTDEATCKVYVKDINYYKEHIFCPLYREKTLEKGINMEGVDCDRLENDPIGGILVDNGTIIFIDR